MEYFAFRATTIGIALSAAMITPAYAAKTAAGTVITNTAKATYDLPSGGTSSVNSNTTNLTVDEILDVSVASLNSADVSVAPGSTNQVLTFKVKNAGNGQEAFKLTARDTATGVDFAPTTTSIVIDSNNNGTYDPGVDTVYTSGSNDPVLAAGGSTTVFVLSSIPATATNGQRGEADLIATSATGSGTPGTVFAGKGDGGTDAVVGSTTATASDKGFYAVSSTTPAATVVLSKSATVSDPFGGTSHVPGSTITYSLAASVSGSGSLANVVITDTAPNGTTYQAGTLDLAGTALTDAADGDAGEVVNGAVTVRIGTLASGSPKTVTFKVKVN